jgi:hypothetical protein
MTTELVHLCAGPSGAGKTRWLLPMFHNDWRRGKDILGHRSYPVPMAYVVMDRPYTSVEATLLSLDIDPLMINVIPGMDLGYKSINQVVDHAKKLGAKFLLIEMFSYLLPGTETRDSVRDFMGSVQRLLCDEGMTIMGTMESPKMKPKDVYKNPRQRISGPASWGHCGETIVLVEPNPKNPEDSPYRQISIHTRNGKPEIFHFEFRKDGHLHPCKAPPVKKKSES